MKTFIVSTLAALSLSANAGISTSLYKFTGDTAFSGFCEAVIKDDLPLLKSNVKQQSNKLALTKRGLWKKMHSIQGVTCNGMSIVEFSKQRQAKDVYAYLMGM